MSPVSTGRACLEEGTARAKALKSEPSGGGGGGSGNEGGWSGYSEQWALGEEGKVGQLGVSCQALVRTWAVL